MIYVALLRGINVGGKSRVEMSRLKDLFGKLGFENIKTYINSGNIIFSNDQDSAKRLCQKIEQAIETEFGFTVPVVIRTIEQIKKVTESLPETWTNDQNMKCDVMFLWEEIDHQNILEQIPHNPDIEDVKYIPGAVFWRIDRSHVTRGKVIKIVGTDVYKKITIRNCNTVRKIYELMQAVS